MKKVILCVGLLVGGCDAGSEQAAKPISLTPAEPISLTEFDSFPWLTPLDDIRAVRLREPDSAYEELGLFTWDNPAGETIKGVQISSIIYQFEPGCVKRNDCALWGGVYSVDSNDQSVLDALISEFVAKYGEYERETSPASPDLSQRDQLDSSVPTATNTRYTWTLSDGAKVNLSFKSHDAALRYKRFDGLDMSSTEIYTDVELPAGLQKFNIGYLSAYYSAFSARAGSLRTDKSL